MSASQPPSNPLDEVKNGITASPPHEEFKAGVADKSPLLQNNQPRYAFGWFDKWLLAIPAVLVLILCLLAWVSCNPAVTPTPAPTSAAAITTLTLNAPSSGTTAAVGETVTLSGRAPPGSEVQLLNRGKVISTTTADANGNYEFSLSAAQPGVYELQTVATINGQQVTSPLIIITVTGQVPNATSAASGGANATPQANVTSDANALGGANATVQANATTDANASGGANATTAAPHVISLRTASSPVTVAVGQPIQLVGIAPPGATVELYNYDNLIATTTADANGNYQFDLTPTAPGEYELRAVTTVNGQQVSSEPVTFIVPEAGAGAPATSAANAAGTPSAESTPAASKGGATGGVNNTNAPSVNLPANAVLAPGAVMNGTAPPNSKVVISLDGKEIGSAVADANGTWQLTLPNTLELGTFSVTVVVTDANGNPIGSPSQAQTITIAPGAEATPSAGSSSGGPNAANVNPPTVNLGAAELLTAGALLTGTAPPNSHVVIYWNEQEIGSADADANGAWEFTVPETVPPGEYALTVVVTDANGKPIGTASEKQTVHIAPKPLLPVTGGEFK